MGAIVMMRIRFLILSAFCTAIILRAEDMEDDDDSQQFSDFLSFKTRNPPPASREEKGQIASDLSCDTQFRRLDGFCNNLEFPHIGATNQRMMILPGTVRTVFEDDALPNARNISNRICHENTPIRNDRGMSELVTFFGQFLDHTITETAIDPNNVHKIIVPDDDQFFRKGHYIPFQRSIQKGQGNERAPVNELTSYIDASSVYGSSEKESSALREHVGGRLKLPRGLLPKKEDGNFKGGDGRAHENINLSALHLLWAREHNSIAAEVAEGYPKYSDEEIFQLARHIVAAELQAVVYYSFIPALMGSRLSPYTGYKTSVHATVSIAFSTVAFRVGHTMLNHTVNSIDANGKLEKRMLRETFFNSDAFVELGIDNLLRGMMGGHAAEVDNGITQEVRNFLISEENAEQQLDLAAFNIRRGRDHGVPPCNALRKYFKLEPFHSFEEIVGDKKGDLVRNLRLVYRGDIESVDAWICGICEKHVPGSSLGGLFHHIVRKEFTRLRDGDRFYFEKKGYFKPDQIVKLNSVQNLVGRTPKQLAGIFRMVIARNTKIPNHQINRDPFFV